MICRASDGQVVPPTFRPIIRKDEHAIVASNVIVRRRARYHTILKQYSKKVTMVSSAWFLIPEFRGGLVIMMVICDWLFETSQEGQTVSLIITNLHANVAQLKV